MNVSLDDIVVEGANGAESYETALRATGLPGLTRADIGAAIADAVRDALDRRSFEADQ